MRATILLNDTNCARGLSVFEIMSKARNYATIDTKWKIGNKDSNRNQAPSDAIE